MKLSKIKNMMFALCAGVLLSAIAAIPVKAEVAFDYNYYHWKYPDVANAVGSDPQALFDHYQNFGIHEGRFACQQQEWRAAAGIVETEEERKAFLMKIPAPDPNNNDSNLPKMDPMFYYNQYPDIAAVVGKDPVALLNHYFAYGYSEGRMPFYYLNLTNDRYNPSENLEEGQGFSACVEIAPHF